MTSTIDTTTNQAADTTALAGKYLTFIVGHEAYGIPVLKVREIIRFTAATSMPQMPDYVKGVINLRGKIIPVADLRLVLKVPIPAASPGACIIVVQLNVTQLAPIHMGLIVDAIEEVAQLSARDIEQTPSFAAGLDVAHILGIAKIRDQVKTLLDIDRLLGGAGAANNLEAVQKLAAEQINTKQ